MYDFESKKVTLYRAMRIEEADQTLLDQTPYFRKRFKWFSPDLKFILDRVQGTNFSNFKYKSGAYFLILKFEFSQRDLSFFIELNEKEYMLKSTNSKFIQFKNVDKVDHSCYI